MENLRGASQTSTSGKQVQSPSKEAEGKPSTSPFSKLSTIQTLQRTIGNQAVIQMIRSQISSAESVIQPKYKPGKHQKTADYILKSDWYKNLENYEQKRVKDMLETADPVLYTSWDEVKKELARNKRELTPSLVKYIKTQDELRHATDYLKTRGMTLPMPLLKILEKKANQIGGGSKLQQSDLPDLPTTATAPTKNWNDTQNIRDESHKSFWPSTKTQIFADTAFLGETLGGQKHMLCPGCVKLQKEEAMAKDHQHSWNDLRDALLEIALKANENPKSFKVLQTHYGTEFDEFFEVKKNVIYAKHALWNNYSNNLNNLLLLCSTCNSTDKKVADPAQWFKDAPYFGDPFISFIGPLGGAFHEPSGGWGAKAREWMQLQMQQIKPLIDLDVNVHSLREKHTNSFQSLTKAKALPKGASKKADDKRKAKKRKAQGQLELIHSGIKQIEHFNEIIDDHQDDFPVFDGNESEEEFDHVMANQNKEAVEWRINKKQKIDDPLMNLHYSTPLHESMAYSSLGITLTFEQFSAVDAQRKRLIEKAVHRVYGTEDPYTKPLNSKEKKLVKDESIRQQKMWDAAQTDYKKNKAFSSEFETLRLMFPQAATYIVQQFQFANL